ncbi:MAG: RNA polymerase sigma factor [Bacteroidaceae bacterium]|nr:RNA polymerase sigma factor [Bacteroidaceae bacterium]
MSDKSSINEQEITAMLADEKRREAAFSAIIKQYSEPLYWHIRRMVLSHDDANDLLQNTFLKAWSNIDKFRGESQISTWLYRIAVNETLTFLGKNKGETVSLDTPEGEIANRLESDTYFCGDRADALFNEAISRLPHKQRLVFTMKYFQEMKYEDMSQILDTSVGALKASYHLAVKKIEKFLEEQD